MNVRGRRSIGRAPFGVPKETDFSLSGDWKATRSLAKRLNLDATVADLDTVTAFVVGLGLEVEGRTFVGGVGSGRALRRRSPRFEIQPREERFEPAGYPPVSAAEQLHDGGDENHADDRGVDEDRGGEPDPDEF
jgi:hypothetical protein